MNAVAKHRPPHAAVRAGHAAHAGSGGPNGDVIRRLKRIEGQVRGLARMVEDGRYCIDIVTQIGAVQAALGRVEEEMLRDHVGHCVEAAIVSGDGAEQRRKIAELIDVLGRSRRSALK